VRTAAGCRLSRIPARAAARLHPPGDLRAARGGGGQRARDRGRVHPGRRRGLGGPGRGAELLRLRAGDAQARPLALIGATFGAGQALARGLVDEAVPATELAGRSLAAAQRLAALGPAFGLTKRQLRQRFLARVHDLAVLDAEVDAIWQAPPTLERIRSFMTSLK
jgi:enoyl-CoA hydratase/carnithine racemase